MDFWEWLSWEWEYLKNRWLWLKWDRWKLKRQMRKHGYTEQQIQDVIEFYEKGGE